MSEQAAEAGTTGPEIVEIPMGDAAFGALMDALAPEDDPKAAAGTAEAPAAGGQVAQPEGAGAGAGEAGAPAAGGAGTAATDATAAGAGASAAGGTAAAGAAGAADSAAEPGAGAGDGAAAATAGSAGPDAAGSGTAVGADGARPASWTAAASDVVKQLGDVSTKFEERTAESFQNAALTEVREAYPKYFDALEKHPRLLVGTEVPRTDGKPGNETLRSTEDAREWQEAVKSILVSEVRGRATKAMEDNTEFLNTVHASIELFQKNPDLVPHTKEFDVELANRFAAMAQPYELRVEEKLHGYTIPVQPIINQLRTQLAAERAAKAAAAPAAAAAAPAAASTPAAGAAPADPPQAGVPSKAGSSDTAEEFSTLFGTLGLPNLRI